MPSHQRASNTFTPFMPATALLVALTATLVCISAAAAMPSQPAGIRGSVGVGDSPSASAVDGASVVGASGSASHPVGAVGVPGFESHSHGKPSKALYTAARAAALSASRSVGADAGATAASVASGSTPASSSALASADSSVDAPVIVCNGNRPRRDYAYVMMHYEGTAKDPEYVLGTRTLIKSIHATHTREDVVVLASTTVTDATLDLLCSDGAIVQIVDDIPNPFAQSVKPRFLLTLNKLHLWRMTRYKRVIYLDADNIVVHNMDELFGCGRFCVVFMNPCHFHTGLMVVKPDLVEYDRLISILREGGQSYDGADQGFLTHVYGTELAAAPIFVYNRSASAHPDALMRLPIGYNMHHLYRYETMSWDMFRVHRFRDLDPPFLSVTFPITPALKPWYWLPYALFDTHWTWGKHRASLDEYFFHVTLSRVALLPIAYLVLVTATRVVLTKKCFVDSVSSAVKRVHGVLGPARLAWSIGYFAVLFGAWLTYLCVPRMLPPLHGWGLLLLYLNFCVFMTVRLLGMCSRHTPSVGGPLGSVVKAAESLTVPLVVQSVSIVLVFTNVQLLVVSNFVDKMLCVLSTTGVVFFTLARAIKWACMELFHEMWPQQQPVKKR